MVLLLSSIFLLLAPLSFLLVPSNIVIDVITVTMKEDSISPFSVKSKPKQVSLHNSITIQNMKELIKEKNNEAGNVLKFNTDSQGWNFLGRFGTQSGEILEVKGSNWDKKCKNIHFANLLF